MPPIGFVIFINGELVAADSIKFTLHNVMGLDFLPEYPMSRSWPRATPMRRPARKMATTIGDGGFILKSADGMMSNTTWKAKSFCRDRLGHDSRNSKIEHPPGPEGWRKSGLDDRTWSHPTEYNEERGKPMQPFYESDFAGAKFIWSQEIDRDNRVIFRTKIQKLGWPRRWNVTPDIDISGAPFK